jgi:hypothetical protein
LPSAIDQSTVRMAPFARASIMAKKSRRSQTAETGRSQRIKLSTAESLKRVREFAQRKEAFVAAIQKGKNRGCK